MRTLLMGAAALALTPGFVLADSQVTYSFLDNFDETFDVYVDVLCSDCDGLATYNIALQGLDALPLDPETFVWEEATLSTTDAATGQAVGFTSGLLAAPVGADAYSATNSQFNNANYLPGVGMEPIFVEGLVFPPLFDEPTIDLGVPAYLGTLTLPGINSLSPSRAELKNALAPSAALFTGEGPTSVVVPDAIFVEAGVLTFPVLQGRLPGGGPDDWHTGMSPPASNVVSMQSAYDDGSGAFEGGIEVRNSLGYLSDLGEIVPTIENDPYGVFGALVEVVPPTDTTSETGLVNLTIGVDAAGQLPPGTVVTADLILQSTRELSAEYGRLEYQLTAVVGAVPEPATAALLAAGVLAACVRRRAKPITSRTEKTR